MKIAVFGTETQDGISFIKHALRVGFKLQLLATESTALAKLRSSNAMIIQGCYDAQNIARCLAACDATVILVNEALTEASLDLIINNIENHSITRLVICDDTQKHENYDDFRAIAQKLSGTSVDWTVIKRTHEDMTSAIKQIDASLIEEKNARRSFAAYVINQVTDSRLIGATVMLTTS